MKKILKKGKCSDKIFKHYMKIKIVLIQAQLVVTLHSWKLKGIGKLTIS